MSDGASEGVGIVDLCVVLKSNAMKRATAIFLIAASVLVANSALAKSTQPKVTFVSECS